MATLLTKHVSSQCKNAVEQVRDLNVCSCRIKPGLAVESQQAAATLLLQQGWLHYSQAQQHTAGGAVNAAAEAGQAALACFQKAASCIHSFGATRSRLLPSFTNESKQTEMPSQLSLAYNLGTMHRLLFVHMFW